ncbi:MAG TPA: DUF805 domain-containing protein, partial [Devosia sp.]|nr:DUF805 domain-containing protein [Devosia sp.]
EVLHYDDNIGTGQISGADGIRYNFTRADLKQLVPVGRGTKVDFDFEGKQAKDIYIDTPTTAPSASPAYAAAAGTAAAYDNTPAEPDLGLWGYFKRAYTSKFAKFSGRARRKEYWSVVLFSIIVVLIGYGIVIAGVVANPPRANTVQALVEAALTTPTSVVGLAILAIWLLVSILPGAGLLFRRVHDIGWSGWIAGVLLVVTFLGYFVEYLGTIAGIAILVIAFIPGNAGANKYGPPPK